MNEVNPASEVVELPLFPLNTVLFPGQVLPLQIFEPRYLQMVRQCLAEDLPFGVVLIQRGREVGDAEVEPHAVGTMARIVESTHMPDGRMHIVVVGTERFRIRRLLRNQLYLRGEVEQFPLGAPPDENTGAGSMAHLVREKVGRYIDLIAQAAGLQIQVGEMPEGGAQLGYLAAVAMQIDNTEKQRLLSGETLGQIYQVESALLNRENSLLTWMVKSKEWPEQAQFGASGTLLPN